VIRAGKPSWDDHHDIRKHRDDGNGHHQRDEERQRGARYGVGILAAHGLQHEQVGADRRRHLGHLHHQHHEMPNQTRSKPTCLIIGITIAVVALIIEMPSTRCRARYT
jgi:hypothetical protein